MASAGGNEDEGQPPEDDQKEESRDRLGRLGHPPSLLSSALGGGRHSPPRGAGIMASISPPGVVDTTSFPRRALSSEDLASGQKVREWAQVIDPAHPGKHLIIVMIRCWQRGSSSGGAVHQPMGNHSPPRKRESPPKPPAIKTGATETSIGLSRRRSTSGIDAVIRNRAPSSASRSPSASRASSPRVSHNNMTIAHRDEEPWEHDHGQMTAKRESPPPPPHLGVRLDMAQTYLPPSIQSPTEGHDGSSIPLRSFSNIEGLMIKAGIRSSIGLHPPKVRDLRGNLRLMCGIRSL